MPRVCGRWRWRRRPKRVPCVGVAGVGSWAPGAGGAAVCAVGWVRGATGAAALLLRLLLRCWRCEAAARRGRAVALVLRGGRAAARCSRPVVPGGRTGLV